MTSLFTTISVKRDVIFMYNLKILIIIFFPCQIIFDCQIQQGIKRGDTMTTQRPQFELSACLDFRCSFLVIAYFLKID